MGLGSFARFGGAAALSVFTLMATAGCSGEENLGPVPIQKSTIRITPSTLDFEALADLSQFTATRTDGQGRPSNLNHFVWRSLSPNVAQVDGAGRVVSLGQGTATIEVSVSGESARAQVVVDQVPVLFAMGRQADTLDAVGQQVTLSLEARDRNGFRIDRRSVDWRTDDPSVVTIDELGEVTSRGEGETTIFARKRGSQDSRRVRVRRKASTLTVLPGIDTIPAIGSQLRMRAYETDATGKVIADDGFTWSSSNAGVASVDNSGIVTSRAAGTAEIVASSGSLSGHAVIVVLPSAERITVTPRNATIPAPGQTVQLTATAKDAAGNAVSITAFSWASDRPGAATVNGAGLVTGVGQGTARIAAIAPSGAMGFSSVSVGQISLNVAPKTLTLNAVGDQAQLAIYPRDASGASASCPSPSWSSSNAQVVSVNVQGVTVAKAVGSAMVIVAACGVNDTASVTVLGPGGQPPAPPPPPPPPAAVVAPDLPRAMPDIVRPPIQRTVRARNAGELTTAVSSARAGDEILLTPGARYVINSGLRLPPRADGGWVVIRTDINAPANTRVDSTLNFATITCSGANCQAIHATQPGDYGFRFELVEIETPADGVTSLVRLHTGGAGVPARFVFDRVYAHPGQASWNLRQCFLANASGFALLDSIVTECHDRRADSGAVIAWNSPGPYLVRNNLITGAMPIFFGGTDPANAANVPHDITVARNHVMRPNSWKSMGFVTKNLLEFKLGIRVHIWGNVFENHWRGAQAGYAILFKTTNQGCGFGTFSETGHVTFERNIVRNVDMGFNIAVDPTGCGVDMHDVLIKDNVCERCGPNGDHGTATSRNFLVLGSTDNLTIDGYTSLGPNMHTAMEIAPQNVVAGRTLTVNNFLIRGPTSYGLRNRPISDTYTNATFTNAYAVGDNCQRYEAGWSCPGSLPPGTGANMTAINAATSGVVR